MIIIGHPNDNYGQYYALKRVSGSDVNGFTGYNSPSGTIIELPSTNQKTLGQSEFTCACGDPINVATGNVYEQTLDYSTVGQNPLSFRRYYNSMASASTAATAMGKNWRSEYDRFLRLPSSTTVIAERPDGQELTFSYNGTAWASDTDVDYQLTNSGATWTLIDKDDVTETYTVSGTVATLATMKQRNGYTQTLNYTSGQLTSVTDSYGRSLGLTYTGSLLTGVTTPDSLVLTYGYSTVSGSSLLTSVGYNTSPATSQTYAYANASFPFALTSVTDEKGNLFQSWQYDSTGRGTSNWQGGSLNAGLTSVAYDDSTGNRTVTGPLGIAETYKFTTLQGIPKLTEIDRAANGTIAAATRTFTYDTNGYLATATDWNGNSTHYTNDSHGHATTTVEAYGTGVARTTTVVYDTTWPRLPHTITTPGLTTTLNYDSATGNLLTKVLTDTTTQSVPYSTNGQTRTWTYTYTTSGQLQTVRLPRTDVVAKTTYTYTGGTLTSIADPLGHTFTINSYTAGGLPTVTSDQNGQVALLSYDARLRLHQRVFTSSHLTTTWDYDAAGNLTKWTPQDGYYLNYGYDNAHRLTSVTNALNESMPLTLDAAGDVTQALWQDASSTTKRQHTATFDAAGRKLTDVGGMSQTTTYTYDSQGNITGIKTPLTWTTAQLPDALNRIQKVTDYYGFHDDTTFDAHDRPLTVSDRYGHVTTYIYDGFGEAISIASPDSGTTVYHYDADGNVSSKTDAASQITNWTYDAMDRPLTRTYPADSTLNVAYTYDQAGHNRGVGHLTTVTDQAGSSSLSWDECGNLGSNARTIASTTYTTSYVYYGQRSLAIQTYPSGWQVQYNRDTAGQISGITTTQPGHASVNLATSITHLPFGPVKSLTWGNGVTHATTFDNDYRQTGLTDTGTASVQSQTYTYDADNNLKTITDALNAANSQTFGYDALEHLSSANSGTGGYGNLYWNYNHDNRINDTGTVYTLASTSNRVTAIGSTSVGYFGTGNINAIGTATMTYNKANQLASASAAGNSATYGYDAFGQRLKVQPSGMPLQVYNYDTAGNLIAETFNNIATEYVYLDNLPLAVIQPAAGTVSYIHADRLGTPSKATSSTQASVWSATYKPFGQTYALTGTITQNLRLPGQYADNTGYYHNGFRDYNPAMGSYLESDPIGLAGGTTDTFAYAGSNPGRWTDRSGLHYDQGAQYGPDAADMGYALNRQGIAALLNRTSVVATDAALLSLTNPYTAARAPEFGALAICSKVGSVLLAPSPEKTLDLATDLAAERFHVGNVYSLLGAVWQNTLGSRPAY